MSSVDLKFEVGDLVIPNLSVFKGDECRIVRAYSTSAFVETLSPGSFGKGHTGSGIISVENGWNYESCALVHSFRDGFKIGDRVKTPDGVGIIKCFNKEFGSLGVAHDEVVTYGHDIGGYCEEGYGRFYTKDELSHSTEEPKTTKESELPFKVGDKVEINPGYKNGSSVGVVKKIKNNLFTSPSYGVEFSQYDSSLRDLEGDCATGYGWYYYEPELKLVTTSSKPMTPVTPEIPEIPEKRFTVGQKVTYKPESSLNGYRYGGIDQGGFVGEIKNYLEFTSDHNCYKIIVTEKEGGTYSMLESEFEDYLDPAFTAKKASIPESAFTSTSASKPTQRFKVGDKVTYKPKNSLPGSKYNFSGEDQGFFVGTIKYYGSYYPEYGCYLIDVSTKEEGNYTMLESEFFEYDGIIGGYTSLSIRSVYCGTTGVGEATGGTGSAGTWVGIMEEEFEKRDEAEKQDLSEYIQAPSVPKKKSTKRKLVIVDKF
jgi:hypothetical protein